MAKQKKDIFSKVPELNYQEDGNYSNPGAWQNIVNQRRSCRVYTDEQIPENIVKKCLSHALLAPNSSNLQSWQFYWIKSEDKKKRIAEACLNQPTARTAQELIVCVAHPEMWRTTRILNLKKFEESEIETPKSVSQYYNKIVPLAYNQGVLGLFGLVKRTVIFFRGMKQPTPRGPVSRADMRVWANKTTALACQQLMLAFRAHGYDTCPMEGFDEKMIKKVISIPKKSEVCMVISAGKRAENGIYGPRVRFDENLFIHEV